MNQNSFKALRLFFFCQIFQTLYLFPEYVGKVHIFWEDLPQYTLKKKLPGLFELTK